MPPARVVPTPPDCDTRTTQGHFDRACASATLAAVSNTAHTCPGLPVEGVHVKSSFASTGAITDAVIDRPTPVDPALAECVQQAFRRGHIPPFTGSTVYVGKMLYP
jgi:hypothetical protein